MINVEYSEEFTDSENMVGGGVFGDLAKAVGNAANNLVVVATDTVDKPLVDKPLVDKPLIDSFADNLPNTVPDSGIDVTTSDMELLKNPAIENIPVSQPVTTQPVTTQLGGDLENENSKYYKMKYYKYKGLYLNACNK